ncbi:glycosyltransferase family 4 protein [Roseivirga misakiensis]|uniref:Glycosyl transferase family 1 domain-containing protein n=1 Tax=Roseivirga misakiensis TaxID=1563681 RepID=A0A1E5T5V9_9BACT|nr:glycosyltransferase family 1 protein [Roseivirga misakiensis]OEK06759.1 hypothetical protein BFP71_03605 [Roseivirga misakiensis]
MSQKVIIDTFFQLYADTGIRTYTDLLVKAAVDEGVSENHYQSVPSIQLVNRTKFFRHNPNRFKRWLFQLLYLFWKQFVLPIITLLRRADVLICPDYVSPMWKLPCLKMQVIHSPFFWQHPENYSNLWLKYQKWLIKKGFRGRSLGLTTSHYVKKAMDEYLDQPLEVVYQLSKPLSISPSGSPSRLTQMIKGSAFILHVGYFDQRKNLPILVRAFDILRKHTNYSEYKLVLAGGRGIGKKNDAFTEVEELVDELGLAEQIVLPGFVDEEELAWLYAESKLYVFPSYNEGFGIPILEAMSADVPVIVSDCGSLMEIGDDAVVSFSTFNAEDLAGKMERVLSDNILNHNLVEKGKKRLGQFTKEKLMSRIDKLIKENAA